MHWVKRYNAGKKLKLNFFIDLPLLPEGVTKDMVEAYRGENAKVEESDEDQGAAVEAEDGKECHAA